MTAATGPSQARCSEKSDSEKLNHERGEEPLPVNWIEDGAEPGTTGVEWYGGASGFCPWKPRLRRGIVVSRETRGRDIWSEALCLYRRDRSSEVHG